jgi:hypothetical protein
MLSLKLPKNKNKNGFKIPKNGNVLICSDSMLKRLKFVKNRQIEVTNYYSYSFYRKNTSSAISIDPYPPLGLIHPMPPTPRSHTFYHSSIERNNG